MAKLKVGDKAPSFKTLNQKGFDIVNVQLINAQGQVMTMAPINGTAENGSINIKTVNLSRGIYFINVELNGKIYTEKLIID